MRNPIVWTGPVLVLALAACGREAPPAPVASRAARGTPVAVLDTIVPDAFEAAGVANPVRQATLSTKLMGAVTAVLVHEGGHVAEGQLLVRLDARDLDAKRVQVEAGLAEAIAMRADAAAQAGRIRGLYADSAATRAQLDQAETGLARADAAVATARGMAAELDATADYASVRAPFAGIVTRRFVDPGAFAAPGAPLVTVEDASTLRVTVSAAPDVVRGLRRGTPVTAYLGDTAMRATIEGAVPAGSNLYTVNALVPNAGGAFLAGSAAALALPRGTRHALLVPAAAVVRQGDLSGVQVLVAGQPTLRWVKLGRPMDGSVEVLSGVTAADTVLVPGAGR